MDLFLQSYLGQSCLKHLPERKSDAKALPPSLKMIQTALQRVGAVEIAKPASITRLTLI